MRDQRGSLLLYNIPAPDIQSPKGKISKKDVEEMTCMASLESAKSMIKNIIETTAYHTQPPVNHCLIFAKVFINVSLFRDAFIIPRFRTDFSKKQKCLQICLGKKIMREKPWFKMSRSCLLLNCLFDYLEFVKHLDLYCLFISSTNVAGLTVISTHAGRKPLLIAFLADFKFDQAQQ